MSETTGITSGILTNAFPLSKSEIKELENRVLQHGGTFVYLDENTKLCFAQVMSPDAVKDFAWHNASVLTVDANGLFNKQLHKKTGLDTYTLFDTYQKETLEGEWVSTSGPIEEDNAGLYQTGSNYTIKLKTWDELIAEGAVTFNEEYGIASKGESYELLTGDLILPENTTTVSDFSETSLTGVIILEGVTEIEWNAFTNCTELTKVEMSNTVTTIYYEAFYGCTSLSQVVLPEGLIDIQQGAFAGCSSLTSIILPSSITTIEQYAFGNTPLSSITFNGTVAQWEALDELIDVFRGATATYVQCSDGTSTHML